MKENEAIPDFAILEDEEIFETVIRGALRRAERSILIATANLRNIKVPATKSDRRAPSFARLLWRLVQKGVDVRILHAATPTKSWLKDENALEEIPEQSVVRRMCPRVHFKAIILEGVNCYIGSANITGAGVGAKSARRRNFEIGIWTSDPDISALIERKFNGIWNGEFCRDCDRPPSCSLSILEQIREDIQS
ncbi:MAG: phospholipase D family protein [Planctomycetota bacterium]|jgi:phosphatidylserine/phosphatidylglycerophosphate/cardiolipin synthase-like enzyme